MKELWETLARRENEFWLYVGCAMDRNKNVTVALAHTWQKLLSAKREALIHGNDSRASNALKEYDTAFNAARLAWGV
jgi:hypothetical protein